ncbi:hypothetical protein Srubr_26560 [Streptomyces rubradiris]|uniref:Uncharacterized protein n=1 Tax=Streptomyces rubradiris TaxID=285531 RepID=A0ABQ3RAC6_STRRR|nr:hypothetical protein GCM10018792_66050 [Streptomyces rubradiris]GHI52810.1 hypothetical protein Srubr_26560 [Streptomyces rubradiris]
MHRAEQNRLSLRERTGSGWEQKMYAQRRTCPAMPPPYARPAGARVAAPCGGAGGLSYGSVACLYPPDRF